jgi:hypothetical protein
MTKQERLISEIIALYDQNLESMINKSDQTQTLLLQSIFDRQIQEYIHWNCQIPIDIYDRFMYRLNSVIIHNPNEFDRYKNLFDKNRFISEREYHEFSLFFSSFLKCA